MVRGSIRIAVVAMLVFAIDAQLCAGQESAEQLRSRATVLAYNLDHDDAIALLRKAVALEPDDPANHRSLASVLWLNMLFTRGAVTVDHYLGGFSRARVALRKPSPEVDAEFRTHVARAIELAEQRVAARPQDPQAHYDLGAAVGLQATYVATVEGRLLAGFKAARRSYDEHEKVLKIDPARKDAGLIVGTYRYIVSTLSLPMRMMAYIAGFGGGKERGIAMLEETASAGVLVYNRERRYDGALRALEELRRAYPRNRLVLLETGATALRAKRFDQADDVLTKGLAMLAGDTRPRMPGEEALWKYKRGAARGALGRVDAARSDLAAALDADAAAWVQGRSHVELARLALREGDRAGAVREARTAASLCERGNDPACVDEAKKLEKDSNAR
jgi:tetratricopeptide (TPR) repeat protein